MSRLIAFGCSLTYGDGLEDCVNFSYPRRQILNGKLLTTYGCGPNPSKIAWPSMLGKLLHVKEVINKGHSGCSNKFIWKNIVDFKYQADDLVFINWTFIDRYTSIRSDSNIHIGAWMDDKHSKNYFKSIYSDIDSQYDFYIRTDHAKKYLDSQGIKNFHTRSSNSASRAISDAPEWWNVSFLNVQIDNLRDLYPIALDNSHPGPQAHAHFANDIYSEIKKIIR